jgi:hypothetical protein
MTSTAEELAELLSPLPYMPSWSEKKQIYFFYIETLCHKDSNQRLTV